MKRLAIVIISISLIFITSFAIAQDLKLSPSLFDTDPIDYFSLSSINTPTLPYLAYLINQDTEKKYQGNINPYLAAILNIIPVLV